jgi:demethylmenaquinone methyltransferase/2-methoxy-6-polyprenyl-1,4-benzoquinol methylase
LDELKRFEKNKKGEVRAMFNGIARHYDFLNHFLSFGIDVWWRKKLIRKAATFRPKKILDMATGTADLAIMAASLKPEKIIGADIAKEMLNIGAQKVSKKKLESLIELVEQDAEVLTFDDQSFDLAMIAFGVRNFADLTKGLSELYRVIKPGGALLVLEFSTPSSAFVRIPYTFYSNTFMPFAGRLFSRNKFAYKYLPDSIRKFPSGKEFAVRLKDAGFHDVLFYPMTFGVVTLYVAVVKS